MSTERADVRQQLTEALDEQTIKRVGAFIANDIRAELVCCDVYERVEPLRAELAAGQPGWGEAYGELHDAVDGHEICYWGEAAARIAEGRDDHDDEAGGGLGTPEADG